MKFPNIFEFCLAVSLAFGINVQANYICVGSGCAQAGSGITSINSLSDSAQTLVTGSSGSDFGISSSSATHTFNIPTSSASNRGLLSSSDWSTFNSKVSSSRTISASSPLTGGGDLSANRSIGCQTASGSQAGCLSSTDWTKFNSLTANQIRYVNYNSGNDSTGDGTITNPWKTIQKAYNSITDATNTNAYTVYVQGTVDPDSSAITGKPDINFVGSTGPLQSQGTVSTTIGQAITISGGSADAGVVFAHLITSGITWTRNDTTSISLKLFDVSDGVGITLKQSNALGLASLYIYDSVLGGTLDTQSTSVNVFNSRLFGTCTLEDPGNPTGYEFIANDLGCTMTAAGPANFYVSGNLNDGITITGTTTVNGTPAFNIDSGSIPTPLGSFTLSSLFSLSSLTSYSPVLSTNWATPPSNVADALDRLVITQQSALGSQPTCDSTHRGLQWLVQGGSGVADLFQICVHKADNTYGWVTH